MFKSSIGEAPSYSTDKFSKVEAEIKYQSTITENWLNEKEFCLRWS